MRGKPIGDGVLYGIRDVGRNVKGVDSKVMLHEINKLSERVGREGMASLLDADSPTPGNIGLNVLDLEHLFASIHARKMGDISSISEFVGILRFRPVLFEYPFFEATYRRMLYRDSRSDIRPA